MPDTNQNHSPERQGAQPGARQEPKARRKRRRRPIWLTVIIRFFQLVGTLLLIGVITGCFMACFAAVYVKTAVMPKTHLDLSSYTMNENSVIYYQDKDTGELVELQTLTGKENVELVEYKDIPEDLIKAFIAVEDKRFPTHHGVDWRRTASGLLRMFTGGNIQGGSTITQQLIKNVTQYDDVTVTRKILEIFTALELEDDYDKKDILTLYMNRIWMGNGCRGVQAASKLYFGKDVSELSLAECASLAGITNNPSLYAPYGTVEVVRYQCQNPKCKDYSLTKDDVCATCGAENSFDSGSVWTNREFNKARQETILRLMARDDISENGAYITEAERDAAIAEPLVFRRDAQAGQDDPESEEEKKPASVFSWYVEAAIKEATKALMDETTLSEDMCRQRVFSGGLKIITAYDPDAQAAVDAVYNDRSNLNQVSSKTGKRAMSSITIVDNQTGYVVAMGSTDEKTVNRGTNWPVDSVRQPGSSIKPLSVYSPALEMGLISPATVVDDNPQLLNGKAWPTNSPKGYRGLTTVLDGVTRSVNTVALRVLEMVTPQASYDFMLNRYGFTSLEPYLETSTGNVLSDIDRSPLSMGGLTHGVSTFEMAAAYATFPRGGVFSKGTTVLEIRDASDRVILDNRPDPQYVIKATTAYYINSILTNVINSSDGTGKAARLSGMTAAGKTGTTNNRFDLWFCGYTPYYTAAVWTGYPSSERIDRGDGNNPSVILWQKVMSRLHEGKENREFAVPETLNTYQICRDCGKRALEECQLDIRGSRVQTFRLFAADAPAGFCECHKPVRVCVDSPILDANGAPTGRYHRAGEFCPEESVKTIYMVDFQRELATPDVVVKDADALLSWYDALPNPDCDVHTGLVEPTPPVVTDDPWASEQPTWPPEVTDNPFLPPVVEPTPTPEPTVPILPPEPTIDPVLPPDDPYIPAGDQGNNGW